MKHRRLYTDELEKIGGSDRYTACFTKEEMRNSDNDDDDDCDDDDDDVYIKAWTRKTRREKKYMMLMSTQLTCHQSHVG
jgi:hypothetical protein